MWIAVKKSSLNLSQPANAAVVTYLAKIGTVPLLTREGEVELASRIERGEGRVVRAILESPLALAELLAIMDDLAAGKVAPRDVTRTTSDEEDEERTIVTTRLLEQFEPVRKLARAVGRGQAKRALQARREEALAALTRI